MRKYIVRVIASAAICLLISGGSFLFLPTLALNEMPTEDTTDNGQRAETESEPGTEATWPEEEAVPVSETGPADEEALPEAETEPADEPEAETESEASAESNKDSADFLPDDPRSAENTAEEAAQPYAFLPGEGYVETIDGVAHYDVASFETLQRLVTTTDGSGENGYAQGTMNDCYRLLADIDLTKSIAVPYVGGAGGKRITIDGNYYGGGRRELNGTANPAGIGFDGIGTYIAGAQNTVITIRNTVSKSYSLYGLASGRYQAVNSKGVYIVFDNLYFYGCQISYNIGGGTVVIKDSILDLPDDLPSGYNAPEEATEATWTELAGDVIIRMGDNQDAVFWPQGSDPNGRKGVIVRSGANVNIETQNYFIHDPGEFIAEEGAAITVSAYDGANNYAYYRSFLLERDAKFILHQTGTGFKYSAAASLWLGGAFRMEPGSVFELHYTRALVPAIWVGPDANVTMNQPKRVLITSPYGIADGVAIKAPWNITGIDTVNFGGATAADSAKIWNPQIGDWAPFDMQVTSSGGLSGAPDSIQDLAGNPLNKASLSIYGSTVKRFAFGRTELYADPILAGGVEITGTVFGEAELFASYSSQEGGETGGVAVSNGIDGSYAIPLDSRYPLSGGQQVLISVDSGGLLAARRYPVIGGVRLLGVPDSISFGTVQIHGQTQLVGVEGTPDPVVVEDTRNASPNANWDLMLSAAGPLSADGYQLHPDTLVFVKNSVKYQVGGDDLLVYRGSGSNEPVTLTSVLWQQGDGLKLEIRPYDPYAGIRYTTILNWTIANVD